MSTLPSVTIAILTHARVRWLEEALASALWQSYAGKWDVLIVNDCGQQTLSSSDPRVNVLNLASHFPTVGDKRNFAINAANGDWVAWLDDDDYLLPHHCDRAAAAASAGTLFSVSEASWSFCPPELRVGHSAMIDVLFQRDAAVGRVPSRDFGEDRDFRTQLAAISAPPHVALDVDGMSYVYGWANGVYHVSGQGDNGTGGQRYRADAAHRLKTKQEPSGSIALQPRMRFDVLEAVQRAKQVPYPRQVEAKEITQ